MKFARRAGLRSEPLKEPLRPLQFQLEPLRCVFMLVSLGGKV